MSEIKKKQTNKNKKGAKEEKIKESKVESETETENEEDNEAELRKEKAKKLQELEKTLLNVEAKINELKTDPPNSLSEKKLETLLKLKRSLLITKLKLSDDKPSSIWDSLLIFVGLILLCGFLVFSKLNEEYYSNFNWGDGRNLYGMLDIPETSSREEIKKKYRELVTKYHPDKNPGCEDCPQKFLDIQNAYEVLIDEDQRALYDETNGFGNFLKSAATELTMQNYKKEVEDSKDIWIIMVYKNNNYPSEFFSSFWEDVLKSYPFIRFGRINYKTQAKLVRKLPFNVREFPIVFAYSTFMEPHLMEISLRRDVDRGFRKFINEYVSGDLHEIKSVSEIASDSYIYLEVHKSDFPLIISNYYAKIYKERFGVALWFSYTDKRSDKLIVMNKDKQIKKFAYDNLKLAFPSIFNYLAVKDVREFNKDNYLRYCKNRENYCLIGLSSKLQTIEHLIDESKEAALECLNSRMGCDASRLIAVFTVDPNVQPKFVKGVSFDFNTNALLINNVSNAFKTEALVMIDELSELTSHTFNSFMEFKTLGQANRIEELLRPENFDLKSEFFYDYINTFVGFNIGFFVLLIGYFLLTKLKINRKMATGLLLAISIAWSVRTTLNRVY